MKVAVIGSRSLSISNLGTYLPEDTTEIVTNGSVGVAACAREYARANGIGLKELHPDYACYGKNAPVMCSLALIEYSDLVLAFWDGVSHMTKYTIDRCRERGKPVQIHY